MRTSSNEQHENDGGEVAGRCHPFLLLGTKCSQLALFLFGLYFLCCVFGKQAYDMDEKFSLLPLLMIATGLLAGAVFAAGKILKTLNGGEMVSARLCKIEPDNSHEDMQYHLTFEFEVSPGQNKRIKAVRDVDDLVIGQSFFILINHKLGVGLLESNLPGGITFANVYGLEPISKICWFRILVIPVLTFIPLLGLIGSVSALIQQVHLTIGTPFLHWTTIVMQGICFFFNRRYFSPGKPIPLDDQCCRS